MYTVPLQLTVFGILLSLRYGETQPISAGGNIDFLDFQLVNGSAPNEGRVLVRWSRDSPWTALCYDQYLDETVNFQICRGLGFPFACSHSRSGPLRTDDASLGNIESSAFLVSCYANDMDFRVGGCGLEPLPLSPPLVGPLCTHEDDMWLTCGYAGMPDFELRLVDSSSGTADDNKLLQGRCGAKHEWGAICNNFFLSLKEGAVACRELGFSDFAIGQGSVGLREVNSQYSTNYTLFEDMGCRGNETSLTECEHYSLQGCRGYITLSCFNETKEYDDVAYLCGSKQLCNEQCGGRCNHLGTAVFHYCQCDDLCVLFDDCCYDHSQSCDPGVPLLAQAEFTADNFKCVWLPGSEFTNIGYVIVSQCPAGWTDEGTRDLCEGPVDSADVIRSLPVYDEQNVDFKNIYCALCNGRSFDRLQRWDVSATDSVNFSSGGQYYPGLNQSLPTKGWLVTPPSGHLVVRECSAHLVDTCLSEFRGSEIEKACSAYYAPIRVDNTETRYRNPHCAMCHGQTVEPQNSCLEQVCPVTCEPSPFGPCSSVCSPYDDFLTIETLFSLTANSLDGSQCSDGQIFDPFLLKCRVLTCATGYHIRGDTCVAVPSVSPFPENTNTSVAMCLSDLWSENNDTGKDVFATAQIYSQIDPNTSVSYMFVLVKSAQEALQFEKAFEIVVKAPQNNTATLGSQLLCNIHQLFIVLPFTFNESSVCNNNTLEILPDYGNESLLIVTQFLNASTEAKYTKTKVSSTCLQIGELNCSSLLVLPDAEYQVTKDAGIHVVATDQSISTSEYVLLEDGKAVVCSYIAPAEEGLEPRIRRAISFVGSCLSLFALFATFVTYCVFSELRNMAGKCTMNLAAALFTAILLFLLAGVLNQDHGACVFGAVVAHFAWLAAFCWMTVLSFNVARTISSMVPRRGKNIGLDWAFILYMSLAWGLPFIIIIICLILHFCNCASADLIYAHDDICWITDTTARVVAFVVPVSASLFISTCLFIFTIVYLRRTRQSTRAARRQGTVDAAREELSIYAKLCCIVGLTWLFGFLSQSLTGIIPFSYIYLILNYLQGVFIFFAFCFNQKVRGLWAEKLSVQRFAESKAVPSRLRKSLMKKSTENTALASSTVVSSNTVDSML
ncbi:uncharacterized protein LOC117300831 [Asterias rubens]|uniref:uncharacterized protein LOC117300831 n=1 Tax=Asterias rubens TaxID=7604 RepID=UPI0014551021|nr:uncharacterized protein LOC117300831 [Asterias rubens]